MSDRIEFSKQLLALIEGFRSDFDIELKKDLSKLQLDSPEHLIEFILIERINKAIDDYLNFYWEQSKRVLNAMQIGSEFELDFNLRKEINGLFESEFIRFKVIFQNQLKLKEIPEKKFDLFFPSIERHKLLSTKRINAEIDLHVLTIDRKMKHKLNQKQNIFEDFIKKFPKIDSLKWNEVKITFISKDSLKITAREKKETFTFSQIGFEDKRKGDLPNKLWELLYLFAENKGIIDWSSDTSENLKRNMITNINRLSKQLKIIMQLKENPFYPYKQFKNYKSKFEISDKSFQ
jgi:hypothetical protein